MKRPSKITIISWAASVLPAVWFIIAYAQGSYEPYPTLFLTQFSGSAALTFLLLSLACTPLRSIFSLSSLIQSRKAFGLASFYYALTHALTFLVLDYQLKWNWLIPEFQNKPYLLLGLAALLLLLVLALTSLRAFQKRTSDLWLKIHRWVYAAALLVLIHQYFAIKGDKRIALIYLLVFAILMVLRIPFIQSKVRIKGEDSTKKVNQWLLS